MYLLSHLRDTWPDSVTGRPPVPSPGHSDDDNDESDDSDEVEGDEDHIYQSLERQSRADDINVVYAMPLKHRKVQSRVECFDAFTNIHHEGGASDSFKSCSKFETHSEIIKIINK